MTICVTLVYNDDLDSSRHAVFEMQLPSSWASKPCSKLKAKFASAYAAKYAAYALEASALELVRLDDGVLLSTTSMIGEEVKDGAELAVYRVAPIVLVLGEVETCVGLASDASPRSKCPSYVKEVFPKSVLESVTAAGGSAIERLCKDPRLSKPRYPIGSWSLRYEKRSFGKHATRISHKAWGDVEIIVRHVLLEAGLEMHDRHAIVAVPSRATAAFRKELMAMLLMQHGAASACVVPLSACALASCGQATACVIDCGHDSSCAIAYVDGEYQTLSWTLRGGSAVSRLFGSLVGIPHDPNNHTLHLAKKRLCRLDDRAAPGRVSVGATEYVVSSQDASLPGEILFAKAQECPLADLADATPLDDLVAQTILGCDPQHFAALCSGIIVTGSDDALLPGLDLRLATRLVRTINCRAYVVYLSNSIYFHLSPAAASLFGPLSLGPVSLPLSPHFQILIMPRSGLSRAPSSTIWYTVATSLPKTHRVSFLTTMMSSQPIGGLLCASMLIAYFISARHALLFRQTEIFEEIRIHGESQPAKEQGAPSAATTPQNANQLQRGGGGGGDGPATDGA